MEEKTLCNYYTLPVYQVWHSAKYTGHIPCGHSENYDPISKMYIYLFSTLLIFSTEVMCTLSDNILV